MELEAYISVFLMCYTINKIHSTIVYGISRSFIRMNYFKCFVV